MNENIIEEVELKDSINEVVQVKKLNSTKRKFVAVSIFISCLIILGFVVFVLIKKDSEQKVQTKAGEPTSYLSNQPVSYPSSYPITERAKCGQEKSENIFITEYQSKPAMYYFDKDCSKILLKFENETVFTEVGNDGFNKRGKINVGSNFIGLGNWEQSENYYYLAIQFDITPNDSNFNGLVSQIQRIDKLTQEQKVIYEENITTPKRQGPIYKFDIVGDKFAVIRNSLCIQCDVMPPYPAKIFNIETKNELDLGQALAIYIDEIQKVVTYQNAEAVKEACTPSENRFCNPDGTRTIEFIPDGNIMTLPLP